MWGISESGQMQLTLGRIIEWLSPVTVESDTDLTTLRGLEFFAVELNRVCVRENEVVSDTAI